MSQKAFFISFVDGWPCFYHLILQCHDKVDSKNIIHSKNIFKKPTLKKVTQLRWVSLVFVLYRDFINLMSYHFIYFVTVLLFKVCIT